MWRKENPIPKMNLLYVKHYRGPNAAAMFDLLISDAGLPDGTGAELMTRLRELQTVPGVAISGFGFILPDINHPVSNHFFA